MKNLIKNSLIILAFIGFAFYAGQDLIINTARLDGFIYGNKSGGIDTLITAGDTAGQYIYTNAANPVNPLDLVNLRTLLDAGDAGWDSIPFNTGTGDLNAYLGGANVYTTNLDGRYLLPDTLDYYLLTSDSVPNTALGFITKHYLDSVLQVTYRNVYEITLPNAGTLAGSIAAAVEGTDYPDGWVLTSSGTNLLVEHNLGKYVITVNVQYNSSGTIYRSLVPYQTAYNTFQNDDNDNLTIVSISNFYTQYGLKVFILFE